MEGSASTDGAFRFDFSLTNAGDREGTEVVQIYLHDPVASVAQPVKRLVAYRRVPLAPGQLVRIRVAVPADLASFTGRAGHRLVEPGALVLHIAASSTDTRLSVPLTLTGPVRPLDHTRRLHATFTMA